MPRYFLHMKQGAHLVTDHEGSVLPSAAEARTEAIEAAREICAEAIRNGKEAAVDAFVVIDEAGTQIAFLPIAESLPRRLQRSQPAQANERNCSVTPIELAHEYQSICTVKDRVDRLRAEIDQQVNSCRRSIRDLRKQLSSI
jgi:hypothetical protein